MRNNYADELREEIRRMNAGESFVEECTGKEVLEVESKKRNEVEIRVSKSTYTQLAKKAKRANMDVPAYLKKLAGEK